MFTITHSCDFYLERVYSYDLRLRSSRRIDYFIENFVIPKDYTRELIRHCETDRHSTSLHIINVTSSTL